MTGREGGLIMPFPPPSCGPSCCLLWCLRDRNSGKGRGRVKQAALWAHLAEGHPWSFWETSVHSPCVPASHTPLDEHCWQGPICARSPPASLIYLSHGGKNTRSSRSREQRPMSSKLPQFLLPLSTRPLLLTSQGCPLNLGLPAVWGFQLSGTQLSQDLLWEWLVSRPQWSS